MLYYKCILMLKNMWMLKFVNVKTLSNLVNQIALSSIESRNKKDKKAKRLRD